MPETESQLISRAFQELINTKHLYQSIEIDFGPAMAAEAREVWVRRVANEVDSRGRARRMISQEDVTRELLAELDTKDWVFRDLAESARIVPFLLPPVKTLCSECDDVTSFNLWSNSLASAQTMSLGSRGKQVFCLPLQCQACRSSVIVFMIARNGRKIQLVGRSEFENIKVPSSIPKEQKVFYSQALIAFNCGQILPALFLLRTLIEQHMRAVTGQTDLRGDELCDEYNETLDEDFKGRFPSFKDVYGKLSDVLHRADPNESLFKAELERIGHHFEGRDLFARIKKPTSTNDQPKPK
jgi:hypothetical protein